MLPETFAFIKHKNMILSFFTVTNSMEESRSWEVKRPKLLKKFPHFMEPEN
jgi:hypothetical protein